MQRSYAAKMIQQNPKNFTPQYEYWLSLTNLGKQFVEWVEEETRQ